MDTSGTQRRLNFYCQVMIVLLALIAVRVWISPVDVLPRAQAQFGDSGAQRERIIETGQRTNELLAEIHKTLNGTLTVKIESPEGAPKRGAPAKRK